MKVTLVFALISCVLASPLHGLCGSKTCPAKVNMPKPPASGIAKSPSPSSSERKSQSGKPDLLRSQSGKHLYQLKGLMGSGANGAVYDAVRPTKKGKKPEPVVVKHVWEDDGTKAAREHKMNEKMNLSAGTVAPKDGKHYIAMKKVQGITVDKALGQARKDGDAEKQRSLRAETKKALENVHANDIYHGDIHPVIQVFNS
jgi:hypothetical protein